MHELSQKFLSNTLIPKSVKFKPRDTVINEHTQDHYGAWGFCVKKSQFLQFCSGMVKGPVVAVMDREAGSHIGVRDRFHTHATHERAPLGGPTPSAGGPFDFITSTNSTWTPSSCLSSHPGEWEPAGLAPNLGETWSCAKESFDRPALSGFCPIRVVIGTRRVLENSSCQTMGDLLATHQHSLPSSYPKTHITGHTTDEDTPGMSAVNYFHLNAMKIQQLLSS